MNHETVTLMRDDVPVEVDRGIAELIEAMWALGIETEQSCESMLGWTWIVFPDIYDLAELLKAVGPTLLERLADWEVAAPYSSDHRDLWRYHLGPYPVDETDPGGEWAFGVAVEFPPGDVPAVVAALRAAEDRLRTSDAPQVR